MTWILFVWFYGGITSQEFANHKACVDAALSIRQGFEGSNVQTGFVCVEKGKGK